MSGKHKIPDETREALELSSYKLDHPLETDATRR